MPDALINQKMPGNILQRVQKLERDVRLMGSRNSVVNRISELGSELGELQFRAVDENGAIRMVMSGLDLFDEFGVHSTLLGVNAAGTVTFYVDAATGDLMAGAGAVKINDAGISIVGDSTNLILWKAANGLGIGDIFATKTASFSGIAISGVGVNSLIGYAGLTAYETATKSWWNSLALYHTSGAEFDFTNAQNKVASTRGLVIKDEISTNSFSTILYLDMYKNSNAAAPFGVAVSLRGENGAQNLKNMAYYGARYVVAGNGVEDVEFPIAVLVGGTMNEVAVVDKSGISLDGNKGTFRTTTFTIADDAAVSFTPGRVQGLIVIGTGGTGNGGICAYNTGGAGSCVVAVGGANLAATNVQLTGTTGTDTKLTVSAYATDGKLYIENRTGASRGVQVQLI